MSDRRRLTASQWFAISMALLLLIGELGTFATVIALMRVNAARVELIDRISPAAIAASDLRSAMVDQETSIRGYALSGDESFLEPYVEGRRDTARLLTRLEGYSLLKGVSRLRPEIEAVAATAQRWQTEYGEPTRRLVKTDPVAARREASVLAGTRRFDDFRTAVATLQDHLIPASQEARDRLDRNAGIVSFWNLGTGIVVLLSVLAVALVVRGTVVRPLQRLAGAVRGVARGDFEREVTGTGAREVVDLGEDVDAMRSRIVAELDALRTAESDLRRSNAELEQFAYVASHDLQEPLRKVASFCQLLQQRYGEQLDARADQYIGFAVDGAQRMQDLINDLLAFSRVGRIEQPYTDVDCGELVERVRADLGRAIEESGAEIVVPEPLPVVHGDAGLLRLVFQNLIANAVKFRAEAAPRIQLDVEHEGEWWRFRCSDNGIGIDPQYAERIFVLFQRLHARMEYEGTGIGLAMCRKIVEYHGGRMWLDADRAAEGGGSTFCFTLPVQRAET